MMWDRHNSIVMEYQKILNFWDNKLHQPSKFRTKKWVEINDDSHEVYSTGILIRSKVMMLKSSLCNYSDPYILVSGKITINGERADDAAK